MKLWKIVQCRCNKRLQHLNIGFFKSSRFFVTLYFAGDHIKANEMGAACGTYGKEERCLQGLVGNSKEKSPLGRPKCRWADNIEMELQGLGRQDVDWIDLAEDRDKFRPLVNAVMNLLVK